MASSKAKAKTVIHAVKYANGAVVAETNYDRTLLKNIPIGSAVKITPISNNRNYQHHKKFFALLDTGFEYWQPEFSVLTEAEEWIAQAVAREIAVAANDENLYQNVTKPIADGVLARVRKNRENKLDYEGMKTLEAYLNHVMKRAGFFDIKPSQDGGTMKERWSISFANMPQEKFNEVYKGVFGVIWNETLCNVYENEWQLENKVNQLIGFV
ncbi:TPA: DUF1367 family protein [Pasteurella multocida]|uniref:DUF1367 family protein n=1 Tax=Pasteurella multocida TaxID=747 RepID=UPI00201FF562|nr:DUF1367 family protein [Pasteurella multocida]MCL7795932.1 DUF1367 family protein [Pasteurella multocida]HDR1024783.1 DUF1367 family protein [Pasteurella multocida]HDR1055255.1 DUF1367 family protein [Pasteurella multocida]HDR1064353.1 DUF1367 family protein [Pasteurella multocida]HDR1803165.1 DUF1367 family protein [Pasteurella multocida]